MLSRLFHKETGVTRDNLGHVLPEPMIPDHAEHARGFPEPGGRRPYTTPQLDTYGHIQALTLGGSVGVGESGMPSKQPLVGPSSFSNRPKRTSAPRNPARK